MTEVKNWYAYGPGRETLGEAIRCAAFELQRPILGLRIDWRKELAEMKFGTRDELAKGGIYV